MTGVMSKTLIDCQKYNSAVAKQTTSSTHYKPYESQKSAYHISIFQMRTMLGEKVIVILYINFLN